MFKKNKFLYLAFYILIVSVAWVFINKGTTQNLTKEASKNLNTTTVEEKTGSLVPLPEENNNNSENNITQKIKAISWMIGLTMVAPTLGLAGQRVLGTKKPKDDESEAQFWGSEIVSNFARMFPVTSPASGLITNVVTGKQVFQSSSLPLAFKPLETGGKALIDAKSDKEISDKLESLSTTGLYWWNMTPWGRAVPIPLQANKVLWNFHDILTGKIQPEVRDLVTRRPKNERE